MITIEDVTDIKPDDVSIESTFTATHRVNVSGRLIRSNASNGNDPLLG